MLTLTLFVTIFAFKCVSLLGQIGIYCNNAFECVDTEWVLNAHTQSIAGHGYKSLYGPNTSITANYRNNYVLCWGAFACAQISFISNTQNYVNCHGSHSCANIDGLSYINVKYIFCQGSNSCQNSNVVASDSIYCYGSQSCAYSNISSSNVHVWGAHSLYRSTINSDSAINNILNIHLYGYQSGIGGTIICRAGDICNIYCYNNGCEMLYLECEQNSDCNILLNNSTITIPPITNINEYNYTLYDIKYNSQILNVTNNELCDNASNFVFDNKTSIRHSGIIDINEENTEPVCCRSYRSCYHTITFTDISSDIVVCSGLGSCMNIIINTTKPVFCEGTDSCVNTVMNKANNVYCLGSFACSDSVIRGSTDVYCLGNIACGGSTIQSNGNEINVYLFAFHSGYDTHIYCDIGDKCRIHCGGYYSCYFTVVHCNNNCFVDCNTDTRCPKGNYTKSTVSQTDNHTQSPSLNPTIGEKINPAQNSTINSSIATINPIKHSIITHKSINETTKVSTTISHIKNWIIILIVIGISLLCCIIGIILKTIIDKYKKKNILVSVSKSILKGVPSQSQNIGEQEQLQDNMSQLVLEENEQLQTNKLRDDDNMGQTKETCIELESLQT